MKEEIFNSENIEVYVFGNNIQRNFQCTNKDFILLKREIDNSNSEDFLLELFVKTTAGSFNLFDPILDHVVTLKRDDKETIEKILIQDFKKHGLILFREREKTFFHIRQLCIGESVLEGF